MTVFAPSSYEELHVQLSDAVELCGDGPSMIRWSRQGARSVPEAEIGGGLRARKARSGTDVCIIGVGHLLGDALEAASQLEDAGISVTVWDPRVISPPDPAMIADAASHRVVITIEDGLRNGGAGELFRDRVEKHLDTQGRDGTSCCIRVLGMPRTYIPHDKPENILSRYGVDAAGIIAEAKAALS